MKILHTSDWHLGHVLYQRDRTAEQQDMLRQLTDIAGSRQPDVLLVSGDIYHTAQPSSTTQTLFVEAMIALRQACPNMTIIVTAGNHDSASKHEIFSEPWQALGVHTVGTLHREEPMRHLITVPGKGYVLAVPYAHRRNIPDGFFTDLCRQTEDLNTDGLPIVLMAHTTVQGCDFTGHEHATELTVGGIDAMEPGEFGDGYDYVALGHIHHAQFVRGTGHRMRYSGSPLAVTFDEAYAHSVTWVDIPKHGAPPQTEVIEIVNVRPLVTLPTNGYAAWEDALMLLRDFPEDRPAYIRLNVEVDDCLPPGAQQQAEALTEGKACDFCLIHAHRREREAGVRRTMTVQEFKEQDPLSIARQYAETEGRVFDEDMERMLSEAIDMLREEERQS